MSLGKLLGRNLLYHWRGNLAVFLGVVVGTAVLTGALLVGDSLRGSLQDLTSQRLYWVDQVLVGGRFFRQDVADHLPAERVSPVILLQGTLTVHGGPGNTARTGRVTVLGVDNRFWRVGDVPKQVDWQTNRAKCVVNATLAQALGVKRAARVTLHLDQVTARPRESWRLGDREPGAAGKDLQELTVQTVLSDDSPGGRFSINPSPATPRNLFVPLAWLQQQLGQDTVNLQGRVNALLVGGGSTMLQHDFEKGLTLVDWDLELFDPDRRTAAWFAQLDRRRDGRLRFSEYNGRLSARFVQQADRNKDRILTRAEVLAYYRTRHNYLSLQSRQTILDPAVAEAARIAARDAHLRTAPTFVYLANNIASGQRLVGSAAAALSPGMAPIVRAGILYRGPLQVPYSIVAALDPEQAPPLGRFLPAGQKPLGDNEILLMDWDGWQSAGIPTQRGSRIALTYFKADEQRGLREAASEFRLRDLVSLTRQPAADDPDLTPDFPGITDQKLDLANWESPPFPYDPKRVQRRDEQFWRTYRTTPKAYITLAAGQRLWGSRFGQLTSIRMAPEGGRPLAASDTRDFEARLIPALADKTGMRFQPVRERSLQASTGSTDFGMLFLGFSAFLIVSALLLVGLLFRLNLDRRAGEIGLLIAAGYPHKTVRWLLWGEGCLLAASGGVVGLGLALGYAGLLIELFRWLWPSGLNLSFLQLHVTPTSILIGYGAAVLVSLLTIAWAVRGLSKVSPRALLSGETTDSASAGGERRLPRWSRGIAIGSAAGALVLLVLGGIVQDHEMQAMTFFGSGALLLTAGLAAAWVWMRSTRHRPVRRGGGAVARLGMRNAARHPVRSLLTVGLLASATFLVVAVQSFQRDLDTNFYDRDGASGGFRLLAESSRPVYADDLARAAHKMPAAQIYPFRLRAGDDASCLNLYQPGRPRLLGVPADLIDRGGFQFAGSEARSAAEQANPWLLLRQPDVDGAIPVIGDANSVQWILKSKLGGVIEVPNDRGDMTRLRIVALLQDSVFQSELLVGEANFFKLYPSQTGYQFFLIDTPAANTARTTQVLQQALARRGFEVASTGQRVQEYLAIENTYLRTFQILGGFGLLLGALGLAVVLVRSVWERRGELALLRALGYRRSALGWLVLAENLVMLVLGLAVGTAAALAAVAPHLLGRAGEMPWLELAELLALVAVVGLAAETAAVAATLRAPLVPALRRE